MRHALLVLALGLAAGCASTPATHEVRAITSCEPVGAARPVCGFHNPEDLAPLPGGEALLVSEYPDLASGGGGALALLVLASEERRVLFRGGDARGAPTPGWGDPRCPGPPPAGFGPHGIDLATRPDGRLALAVVQHGGRESLELFEVTGRGETWQVAWRGCAVAPPEAWLNEVVLLSDGSALLSNMMPRRDGPLELAPSEPGWVWRWAPGQGFSRVAGTDVAFANGLEVSADESTLYLNSTIGDGLTRIDLASGRVTGRATGVGALDNSTWAPDGKLLLASLGVSGEPREFTFCQELEAGACPIPFQILAVDPVTLETSVRFDSAGTPMGAGTVGLQVGDELFVGSYSGDRILRVRLGRAVGAD